MIHRQNLNLARIRVATAQLSVKSSTCACPPPVRNDPIEISRKTVEPPRRSMNTADQTISRMPIAVANIPVNRKL
jgi:hypothetical protein